VEQVPISIDKGNHRHFMAKEIAEQPEVVGRTPRPLSRYGRWGKSVFCQMRFHSIGKIRIV